MKKLLLFMFAAFAFAACEQAPIEEQSAIRQDAPVTLTVGFEGDDTRIQLNEAQKTVWTKGDQVSVFYFSDANQLWQYNGDTGSRTANLKRVTAGEPTAQTTYNVVAYPYNEDYFLNTRTGALHATLPSTQHYLKDSYGVGDNLMVAQSEFTQFSLKNVCGWLKLQLTGNGETIKSITFRGNDGEQVAGLIHVDTATAEATLASEMGSTEDNNAGGNLVFDDTILTEVTLDCGEGVALGKNATAFYIALPPQTFEQGFTVEITDTEDFTMEQSSDKALIIERNHIQPMAALEFINPATPSTPTPTNNEIWYSATAKSDPYFDDSLTFGAKVVSNVWDSETKMGIITFDGDVTMIGDEAFYNCDKFTSVTLPESVTSIGKQAFYDCDGLTEFTIPDSVTEVRYQAFYSCGSLTEFTGKFAEDNGRILVVDGVLTAFAPAGITEYNIPDSVTEIGKGAFDGCTSLKSVNIPDSVTEIGSSAFYKCKSLKSVNIPDSVTTIGENAFYDCDSLTSVNIPDSVTEIGRSAFSWCNNLTSVTIGDSVTRIGEYAFSSCDRLTSVNIPDSVTSIGNAAFSGCDSLTSVTIGDSVTTIGEWAFSACDSLTSITIPDSVTTIGYQAFYHCNSLTSVNIGDSVTSIGREAFYYCTSLKKVFCYATIPPSLDWYVFSSNGSGRKIYVPAGSVEAYKSATNWNDYASAIVGYDFENGVVVE